MSLSTYNGEQDVIAKIKTIPNIDVMSGRYTQDSFKPKTDSNGLFKPYVMVSFRSTQRDWGNGIVGPEKDPVQVTATCYIVTPVDNETRKLRDKIVTSLLTNFEPTDGSSLKLRSGYAFDDADLGYTRYVQVVSFIYTANLS